MTIQFMQHLLRLYGVPFQYDNTISYHLYDSPTQKDANTISELAKAGNIIVVIHSSNDFTSAFGVKQSTVTNESWVNLKSCQFIGSKKRELRTFNEISTFFIDNGEKLVEFASGDAVWISIAVGNGFILFIGTDIVGDVLRFRQGDPAQVEFGQNGALWGIAGERPNYLFEKQLVGLPHGDRQADYWILLLANYIANKLQIPLNPILPKGAIGALVITGDDDQAYLEKYAEQLKLLNGVPITYFLHPLTKHTSKTIKSMLGKKFIDIGLHPDALDYPDRYSSLLKEQCGWFTKLLKRSAISLRNHGFLNDGYWGHLSAWINEGIRFSSNIPGLDGRVLNGSLLPARVFYKGQLTTHWSILTAIGDGVRFISNMTDKDAALCITNLAEQIREDKIPGVIVLNLHPQNVSETKAMHLAAVDLVKSGFIAWTVKDCLDWFDQLDGLNTNQDNKSVINQLKIKLSNFFLKRKNDS